MARIIGEAGIQIEPETAGFAEELRGDISRDLTAATAGQDRTVRIRVTTDADVAERQIRNALAKVQEATNRIFERTRARAQQLYTFLEQRVVIRIANKIREWTQKTIARMKLLMQPFWQFMRERLDQIRRGWQTVREVGERAADAVAQRWRQSMAVVSAQLSRVRQLGQRMFIGLADAAEPHIARLRRGIEGIRSAFDVVRAYGTASFRVIGDAGQSAFARLQRAATPAFTAIRSGFDRTTAAATRWGRTATSATRSVVEGLGRVRDGFRSTEAAASAFSGRLGTLGGVARRAFTGMQRDVQNLGRVIVTTNRVIGTLGRGIERAGERVQNLGNRVRGTSTISRIFSGVLRGVGAGLQVVTTIGKAFGSVLSGAQTITEAFSGVLKDVGGNLKDVGSAALSVAGNILKLGVQMSLYAVIAGAVTYAVGALGAAFAGLPALIGAAVVSFAAFKLGMDGIKRAYETGLKPALDQLKTQVENVFERTLTPAFQRLGQQLIPQITGAMKGLAQAFADGGVQIIDMVNRADNIKKIQDLINNTANEVRGQLVPALMNVIQAFIDIGANAAIMRDIVGIFTDLTNKTADWLREMNRTGQAQRSLENLRSVLGKLEDLFFRLLTAAMQFFDEATPGMESLLDAIRPTEGVMRTLGEAFGNAARAAGNLIRAIPPETWQRIADAVKRLSDKLLELSENRAVQMFFQGLLEVIPTLIDLFSNLGTAVSNTSSFFSSMSGGLGILGDAFDSAIEDAEAAGAGIPPPIEGAADRTTAAAERGGQGIHDGFLTPVAPLPGEVGSALAPLPPAVNDPLEQARKAAELQGQGVQEGFVPPVAEVPGAAGSALAPLPPAVQGPVDEAVRAAEEGGRRVQEATTRSFDGAAQAASAAMPRVADATRSAMDGAAASAEGGGRRIADAVRSGVQDAADSATRSMDQVAQSVEAAMQRAGTAAQDGGRRVADGVRSGAQDAADSATRSMDQVAQAVEAAMDRAASAAQSGGDRIRSAVQSSFDGVTSVATAAMDRTVSVVTAGMQRCTQTVTQGMQQIRNVYTQGFQQIVQVVTQAWQRIVQAFVQGGQRAVQISRQTGQQILQTFTALAGPMYSAGFQIISRLAAGMIAAQGQAFAAAASTAAGIRARFPASPAKTGPLSGAGDPLRSGGTIVQRLADGMAANAAAALDALDPILEQMVSRVAALAPSAPSAAPSSSLTVARPSSSVVRAQVEQAVRASVTTSDSGTVLAEMKAQTEALLGIYREVAANGYSADMLDRLDQLAASASAEPAAVKTQRQRSLAALGLMG